ncbi:hypothetical protein HC891_00965 [Candidatus Gracilibacteria bacterium]|nr:hypothetical protein [Candidatus Gracilibacteria bacterium]
MRQFLAALRLEAASALPLSSILLRERCMAEKTTSKRIKRSSQLRGQRFITSIVLATAVLLGSLQLWYWALPALPDVLRPTLALIALLLLPGLALLRLLWPTALPLDLRWPLAVGLSCATLPLLLLFSELVGVAWNGSALWSLLAVCAVIAVLPRSHHGEPNDTTSDSSHLLLVGLTLITLLVRLYAARHLIVGQYGDSYHHTVIAQLISERGGLFRSWEPYEPFASFTYHFGFHSLVAALNWLGDVPVTRGVLIIGQVQSALAVPLIYLLTVRITQLRSAGLWAALLVAVVSSMPAYYLNWGRYTQLAGQTVLIAVCVIWMELLDRTREPSQRPALARLIGLTALSTAGLALTHYRVAVFAICFVAVYSVYLVLTPPHRPAALLRLVGYGALAGGAALLLTLPWLLRLYESSLLHIGSAALNNDIGNTLNNSVSADQLALSVKPYLVLLAALGVVLLLPRLGWRSLILPVWAGCTWLAANPQLLGLNGTGLISSFAVLIAAYLVLAPLAGSGLALLAQRFSGLFHGSSSQLLAFAAKQGQLLLAFGLLIWGIGWQSRIADPQFQLLTPADAAAMEWIRRSTSNDARFYVNSFLAYGDTVYAGSDGGWWLPFLSGRPSNLPNILYGIEAGSSPGMHQRVFRENEGIQDHPIGSPQAAQALRNAGFAYLYDGPSANPPDEYITVAQLDDSPYFEQVYSRDGVTIWRVR